ncbi:filamentous hemagglutinin N-terminal domain-containing protein [Polynucleobacter paneuropaeus]|nr:filamentous hemagglutinin N-terminal domain-containing protein [Polynucleobacter paneuropaeus]
MERSLLSSNHPEKQFDVKLPMAGKVFALVCLFALSTQFALAQNKIAVNALPTGGNVVAGAATISSTSTAKSATMNINQTSQRAVINWQTFNVGKNATVNFNQPNSGSVTLNRVVSATPSMIQGAINANGQVILVNPNGVTFGKGAQVNAAGVVASTLNISNQDFMNGKNIYSGNGEGKIVNKGTITATDPNGYIALLAPEIRNQGYLIARMGPSSTVALASGEKISLDFRGTQLIGVSIDKAAYKALIENKRIIETNGGVIIVAAGTARELMSSVIQNTGRISANSIVDNGGVIELVADNVTNSGSISANGGTNGVGGQVNIVGNNITLAANSKTTATGNLGGGSIQVGVGKTVATNTTPASAVNGNANTAAAPQTAAQILASNTQGVGTQAQTVSVEQGAVVDASAINSGNGGAIVIWSQVKTTVNGILKAVGGYLNGNGGLIETSSAGLVSLGKSLSIDTSSSKGSAGLWYVDPIDLTIDGASSAVISAALVNNNVSITVAGNTCPSLGSCTQNGSGNLTIASGADIIKQSGSLTTLTLTASGVFNLNANISGQNLDVIINSSIAYLNAGSTITANQVTVQAQTIYSYGNINSGSLSNLGSAIQLLGSALYISGNLTVGANLANSSNSTSSNSNTVSYNGTLIRQEDLPTYLAAANQTTLNLDQVYATTAANQASFTTAVNNQITLTGTESISIAATAQLLANGTTGGVIMATAPQINLVTTSNSSPSSGSQSIQGNGSLIQANGNNGPGGTISFTAANDFNINVATISASGSTDGGSIRLISSGGNLLMANSLIQTNGGTGRGGSLGVSGANSTTINSSTLEATGFSKGGSIMVGYDSAGKTLPYSESTTIDAATILNANQTDSTNTTGGGLIETSGGTLTQLASINAGRGGMWLLDPYDYVIGSLEASYIVQVLKTSQVYIVSTTNSQYSTNVPGLNQTNPGTGLISINADIIAAQQNGGGFNGINFVTDGSKPIYLGANINVYGTVQFSGPVVITHAGMVNVTAQNPIIFNSSIDADPGAAGSGGLTLNGTSVILGGCVSCTPGLGQLANLSISAPGGITLYGGLKTSGTPLQGTTASIMLSGPVSLMKSITLDSSNADLIIMDAVTTSTTPGQFGSPTSTTNLTINAGTGYSQGGQVYFGSTVNLAGSLTVNNAGTTYLAGNITTTGAQTYNGTVEVLGGNVQLQAAGISNITITGALQGGALANSSIYLYQNGYYSIDGGVMLTPLGDGGINSVTLGGGVLTYTGNNSGLNQSLYTWTPTYGIAGAVLAVGGGAGGNPGGSSGGGGGDGGSVVANRLIQFDANTTYSITVGMGGAAGLFTCCSAPTSGSFGGNTSLNGGGDYITATGGQGARPALTGGFGNGGANTAFGNIGGSGVQAFVQINNPLSNAGIYPNGNATWFGAGGNAGSTGATSPVDGAGGAYVAGGGGGGGNTTYSGGGGSGGYGASGMLMIQQATQANSTALINAGGSFNLGSVNGSGANKSNLSGLNINANNSNSSISGAINGYIALSYSGLQSSSALTLSGSSTYIGSTTIYAGTIKAGSSTAFGNSNNIIYVASGSTPATLDFNGQNLGAYTINVRGAGVGNLGAIINSSATTANFAGSVNLTNVSFIGGAGTGNGAGTIYFNGSVNTHGYGLGFVNYSNDYMTGNNNQISTIAGSSMAILQLASTTNVTIGTVDGSLTFSGPTVSGLSFASNSGSYLLINLPNNALTINNSITAAAISITASNASGGLDAISMSGSYSITSPGGLGINITSTSGNINLASATITNIYSSCCSVPTSAINITSAGDVSLGNLVNQGQGGIRIAAGNQISAGITSGGTITQLGTVNNSGGVVGLSMAAPETSNCASSAACPIESRLGITASNADVSKNISYGVAGGSFTTPGAYTTGNYIDYRQSPSVTYNVSLGSNYTAIYGTSYISSSANTWLATNATVSIAGTAFGYSVSGALANLRFKNSIDGVTSANNVQSTSITSNSLMSSDLTPINVTGTTRTYTITPAPLGISVNGVYSGTNVITPTSFTTYGLVNGDTIGGLSTATLAFKDVNSVNNYVTAISIGTGSAILSNYQLNPLGRNIATNSALMNSVTLTPIALTVSGAVAANKTYDGTTVATLSASGLNGVLAQDTANVALTLSSGSFANKNVGTNITVTAAGSISGSAVAAGDYTLIQPTVTANISPAPLGVSISGTYTGSTLINNPNIGIAGLVNNETLTSISQAVMSSPNVSANGSNYVVSFTIGAGTASLSNYVINSGYYATPGYTNNMVTLTPKTLTTSGSSAYSKTYDGTNIASINPGTLVGVINSDDVSILSNAGTFASSNAANNVVVTPNLVLGGTASSNYSLTQPTSLTANISKAPLGISIATTYNGSTTVTPTILNVNGLVNGETLSSITSAVISNANVVNTLTTYATSITIGSGTASMSNYMLGSTRNNSTSSNSENIVTITPKALSLSAVKVYDGATTLSGSQITMTGLIGTQTLNYTGANINDANVATPNKYISSITLTDGANGGLASNYLAPTLTSAYTYNNATVNQKAVALSATKVYDANNTLTGGQVTINTGVGGETLTYSSATVNDINVATAGKYINAITLGNAVSGNGVASNYLLPTLNSTNAPVTITKASLTVTANAAAMTYGASVLPSFSATITGFVGSDTSSAVTGTASFSTNATPYNGQAGSGSSVGTYSITPALGSLASGNYSFGVFSQGSLVVNKGNLTITASNDSKVYGASSTTAGVNYTAGGTAINSTAGYTTSGLVNGDTITAVTLTSTGGAVPTNVGTYTITPSALVGGTNVTNSNYTISYINASTGLAVNPKVVTLAATKTYDATNALNTVVISGLIGSQTLTYSGATTNDVNVATTGKYLNAITLGNATDGSGGLAVNYALPSLTVASANNAVTITAKVVGLSASKTYDATTTLTGAQVVITTGVGSQTLSYTGATANDANVATANKYISAITLANATDSSGGLASNYALPTLNNANAALTITPKALSLSAVKVYDGATTLSGSQITMTGLIGTQTLNYTGANINDANVATPNKYISSITLTDGANGGLASNYALPTLDAINAPVTITPKTVTLSAIKTYDSTTTLFAGQVTINTGITGEALTYSAGTINNANVSANGSNFVTALTLNSLTGTASNYALPTLNSTNAPVTVNPAPLTVTGSVSPDKTYDGTTVTTVSNGQLQGLINNQTLTLSQAGAFASANAGTAINVVVNDSIANGTGTNAGIASNYSLTQPTDVVANITPKNLTVTGSATSNKVYDGTYTATITGGQLVGVVAADIANVVLTQTGTFTAANVGNAIAITANDSLSGTQAGNYSLTQPTVAAANITPKTLSLSATKTYDSTTSLLGAVTILTGVGTETLGYTVATASDANVVTTGKYITAITLVNGSGLYSNYVLPVLNVANAPVTINPVTALKVVGATAQGKTYDGTTSVTLSNTGTLQGLIGTQTLTLTEAGAFATANAGSAVNVVMNDSISNGTNGGLASNYSLTQPTYVTAPIAKAPLGITVTGTYTASTTIAPSAFTVNGLVNKESITTLSTATLHDANVTTANNYVQSIAIAAGTANMNNYAITQNYNNLVSTTQNMAVITPKSLTVTGTQVTPKPYDATDSANLSGGNLVGVIAGDLANIHLVETGHFVSQNIGAAVGVIAADTITGSASSNYTLVQPTGLSAQISAINLVITISPETKVYGNNYAKTSNSTDGTNISTDTVNYVGNIANNSAKGFSVSGIVGTEDGVSGVTLTSLGGSVTANAASGNAAYAITGSAATGTGLGNYNIQYVSNNYSVLTVTPAPLTITLAGGNNNPAISYGSSVLPTLTPVIAGIVNNDQVSVTLTTSATPYVNGVAGSASSVGSYPITVSGLNNGNYSLPANTQVGTVVVNPAPLNIQANTQGANGSIVYGTPTVLASDSSAFTATGLVNGDKVNTATINYIALGQTIGSNTVSGSTAAGTYNGTLVVSPGSATGSGLLSNTGVSNYTISYSTGNLIITPAPLTVTAVNDAKLVGQSDTPGYAGVIFSGFKNADTPTGLNLTGLKITRINTGVNNDSAGYSSGVLVPTLNSSSLSGNLNSNYTYNYINGDYSILPAGALLVKLPSNTINYGAGITYGTPTASYIPVGSSSPVTLSALVDPNNANNIIVSSVNQQIPATNVALTIGGAAYSGSNNLNVGSYNLLNSTSNSAVGALNPAEPGTGNFTNIVTIGGLSVLPQVVHLSSLNISGVTKSYDGLTSMSTLSVTGGQFVTRDNISLSASGSFADKNVGINNKSYTVGLTLSGSDAKNYVVDGGAVYSGTNGTINPIDYVYYVGSAAGGAWSDPASWKATTAANIIPAASVLTGPVPDGANVKNVIIPVGSSVIYDASVLTPVDASVSLANAGNVSFGSGNSTSNTNLSINMGISGAGTVTITGIGSVTLAGANTYTGNTIISSGSTLYANAGNSIGAGNIQGQGGSFGVAPNASNVIFTQINATGSLRLISDITTSGNQTYGNLLIGQPTVSGSQLTTLTSQNGNITINGTLDSTLPATSISLSNSLLLKTQNGSVTLNSSVGTITPLNIIEVDAKSTNINADVLTNSQQEYCGPSGCFAALTTAQQNANYCSSNDCFSVLTPSLLGSSSAATYCSTNSCFTSNGILSYTLASAGTGDYANTANGVVVIGDNGQPGFLYNQYTSYVSSVNMTPLGIFQNNPVYARTLMSRDPLVKIGGYQMDASATAIHTLQTAAIQLAGDQVTPTVQIDNGSVPKTNNGQIVRDANGNIVPANPLYSQGSLSASVGSTTTLAGSFDIAPGTTTTTAESQSYGARSLPSIVNSTSSNKVSLNVQDPYASINISVPPGITVNSLNLSASTNSFGVNGHSPTGVTGFVQHTALNGAIPTSPVVSTAGRVAAPTPSPTPSTPTTRNSFILAAVAEQTKIERKYDVDASVDVGEIETDDGPAAADDQDDKKKKKAGNQKAAQ